MAIHLLPPSSSAPAIASLTRSYAAEQVPLEDITVKRVDEDMRRESVFFNMKQTEAGIQGCEI